MRLPVTRSRNAWRMRAHLLSLIASGWVSAQTPSVTACTVQGMARVRSGQARLTSQHRVIPPRQPARDLAGQGSGDGPLSVRARPSSIKRDRDRRTTCTGLTAW